MNRRYQSIFRWVDRGRLRGVCLATIVLWLLPSRPAEAFDIIPCAHDGSPATMTFGGFEMNGGDLEIRIADRAGGTSHSVLRVERVAELGGVSALKLVFRDGYTPQIGETWDVLLADRVIGMFNHIRTPALPVGLTLHCEALRDRIRVTVMPVERAAY